MAHNVNTTTQNAHVITDIAKPKMIDSTQTGYMKQAMTLPQDPQAN
jgi:hypothetical protein